MAKIDPDELEISAPKLAGIVSELRQDIVQGKFKPGMRLPTRDELKVRFKTSLTTVQKACAILTREGFVVSSKTGTTVAKRPPHLTCYGLVFPPDPLGVWEHDPSSFPMHAVAAAKSRDHTVIVYRDVSPDPAAGLHKQLLSDMRAQRLAGVIFYDWPEHLSDDPVFAIPDMPRVLMVPRERAPRIPNAACVANDVFLSIEKIMRWLAEKGVKRMAFINHLTPPEPLMNAIRKNADKFGMEMSGQWTHFVAPDGAHNLMTILMRLPPHERPDGIFVGDDELINGVATGLSSAGVRVGRDAHVIAFATFPLLEPTPLPFQRIGWDVRNTWRTCMDLIDAVRRGEKPPTNILIPPIFESEVPK